jgi:hypothetical protein
VHQEVLQGELLKDLGGDGVLCGVRVREECVCSDSGVECVRAYPSMRGLCGCMSVCEMCWRFIVSGG